MKGCIQAKAKKKTDKAYNKREERTLEQFFKERNLSDFKFQCLNYTFAISNKNFILNYKNRAFQESVLL
jgi:hypothetical protein